MRKIQTMAYFVSGTQELCYVLKDAPLIDAISKMVSKGFSQLLVLHAERREIRERDIVGVITWNSIGRMLNSKGYDPQTPVKDCLDRDGSTFACSINDEIKSVAEGMDESEYVIVLDEEKRVVRMVTFWDLSRLYLNLVRPYSDVEAIENVLREKIGCSLTTVEIKSAGRDEARQAKITTSDTLEFAEYRVLLEHYWEKIGLKCSKPELMKLLERANAVRNAVMHFRPEGVTADDEQILKETKRMLDV